MAEVTRRRFIRASAGAVGGVAALGVAGAAASHVVGAVASSGTGGGSHPASDEPVVAYVKGGAAGEVTVITGDRQITHRDPELVARILRAAG